MNSTSPLISIIIATYNSGKVLKACLESVANQTNKDFEVIIIDGKSVDKTLEIVKLFPDIKKVITEQDSGVYEAWNKGIKLCNSDWIMFLGSDDLLLEDAIENYANFLKTLSNFPIDYISAKVKLIDKKGNQLKIMGRAWEWKVFKKYMNVAHVASLHSKAYFHQYGTFNERYKIAGDYELLLRARKDLRYRFLNKIVAKMQFGGISNGNILVLSETFNAKYKIGKINYFICVYDFLISKVKFHIKKFINYGG